MYPLHPRRLPRVVSLALVLILLGLGLAAVSLWRLQTASAGGHATAQAVPLAHDAKWASPWTLLEDGSGPAPPRHLRVRL